MTKKEQKAKAKAETLHEVAMIAVIMGDHITEKAYEKAKIGYINTVDLIAKWAVEFYHKYEELKTDWEVLYEHPEAYGFSPAVMCWDDAVIEFATKKLNQL